MSFKVVKTLENNNIYYSAVPMAWEKDNILYWPGDSKTKLEKIRSDVNSLPNNSWKPHSCHVVAKNINSFKSALHLEDALSKCSDTEGENG